MQKIVKRKMSVQPTSYKWENNAIQPFFKKMLETRKDYVVDMLNKNLSLFDGLVFKLASRFGRDKFIGWYFRRKVSIIHRPDSFGVRIYQKEFRNDMLSESNFINSQFKLN